MTDVMSEAESTMGDASRQARSDDHEPVLSIVIPHLNDLANLDRCLACLGRQTLPRARFEVIVSDNGSTGGTDVVRRAVTGRAVVVEAPTKGAGPARNAGAALARGSVLAFLDSDCRPSPDWLRQGLIALDAVDVAGGAMDVAAHDQDAPTAVEAFELVYAFRNDLYVARKHFTVTANMFVRRSVFDSVGGFANGVSEDVEWCHRARALGFRLGYAPHAAVTHPARNSWNDLARKWRRTTREAYGLNVRSPLDVVKWLARAWVVLLAAVPQSLQVVTAPRLRRGRDRMGAAAVLFRLRALRFAEAHRLAVGPRRENNE